MRRGASRLDAASGTSPSAAKGVRSSVRGVAST